MEEFATRTNPDNSSYDDRALRGIVAIRNIMAMSKASSSAVAGEIGILHRRKIEAAIIAPIYAIMAREIGEERAQAILDEAMSNAAIAAGAAFAEKTENGTDLLSFQDLQVLWTADNALEIEVLTATEERFDYNVTRCRYAETYREMGLGSIGHLLSCNRDAVFCQGYDARIQMTRTQTLMQGADHCDFRYTFDKVQAVSKT